MSYFDFLKKCVENVTEKIETIFSSIFLFSDLCLPSRSIVYYDAEMDGHQIDQCVLFMPPPDQLFQVTFYHVIQKQVHIYRTK